MKHPIVEPNCPHNDPYCGDCHKALPFKTKAEELLIKAGIAKSKSLDDGTPLNMRPDLDSFDTNIIRHARTVIKERKKK